MNYEEGTAMTPGSLTPVPVTMTPVAGKVFDPTGATVTFLLWDKAAKAEPSLTARIDGVEMDFWRVRMRGESHLLGSPPAPLSLESPRGLAGIAGIN